MNVNVDVKQLQDTLLQYMQDIKQLRNELDTANKDIERKANIIAALGAIIIETKDKALIEKMNDELKKYV